MQKEKGNWKWGIEKVLKEIGAEVRIEEIKRMNTGKGDDHRRETI